MTLNNGGAGGLAGFLDRLYAIPGCIPDWFLQLGARVAVAPLFFISGRGKVAGFTVTDSTIFLFEHEFGLPMPVVAAHLAALAGEHPAHRAGGRIRDAALRPRPVRDDHRHPVRLSRRVLESPHPVVLPAPVHHGARTGLHLPGPPHREEVPG